MWRRTYLLLLLIRVYFALSPSYLHPDEHFQGPEVFAGRSCLLASSEYTYIYTDQHSYARLASVKNSDCHASGDPAIPSF